MKKILWLIPVVVAVSFLNAPLVSLKEVVSKALVNDFSITWPLWRYVFEPLCGPAEYMLSFTRYIFQLVSWVLWLCFLSFLWGMAKKKTPGETLKQIFFCFIAVVSFVMFCLLFPLPAPKLEKNPVYLSLDIHSHTNYSHDGVDTINQNLAYHQKLGFDLFFITEHGHTNSFVKFPEDKKFKVVLPGIQVQTTERISLLVLSDKAFSYEDFLNKSIKEVITLAHSRGFIVICPHWWKWKRPPIEELYKDEIDGFEIYNAGYRNILEKERNEIIEFCKARNLLMVGSTDWHGWGRMSDVWTIISLPQKNGFVGENVFNELKKHSATEVLVNNRDERNDLVRYIFEPFFGLYYYFGSLNFKQLSSWILWLSFFYFAGYFKRYFYWMRLISIVFGLIFFAAVVYYMIMWIPLLPENQILGKLLMPILFFLSISWFWLARTNNGQNTD